MRDINHLMSIHLWISTDRLISFLSSGAVNWPIMLPGQFNTFLANQRCRILSSPGAENIALLQ